MPLFAKNADRLRKIIPTKASVAWVFLLSLFILALDQISKHVLSFYTGAFKPPITVIKNILYLRWTKNTGIAFGLLKGHNLIIGLVSLGIVVALVALIIRKKSQIDLLVKIGLGLIIGGALGNVLDRIFFGYVRDFIDLGFWPVFNIADSAVTIGVFLIIIDCIKADRAQKAHIG